MQTAHTAQTAATSAPALPVPGPDALERLLDRLEGRRPLPGVATTATQIERTLAAVGTGVRAVYQPV